MVRFKNRQEAGRTLALKLAKDVRFKHLSNPVVLGLPRGGIPVAYEVAKELGAELDAMVTRKLGVPGHEELAFGAIGPEGVRILDDGIILDCDISQEEVENVVLRESSELRRRQSAYQGGFLPANLKDRSVILVDDGIATGATMRAAAESARKLGARKLIVAVPVGPTDAVERLGTAADTYFCLQSPALFSSVGEWYEDFSQTTDEEVVKLLKLGKQLKTEPRPISGPASQNQTL